MNTKISIYSNKILSILVPMHGLFGLFSRGAHFHEDALMIQFMTLSLRFTRVFCTSHHTILLCDLRYSFEHQV